LYTERVPEGVGARAVAAALLAACRSSVAGATDGRRLALGALEPTCVNVMSCALHLGCEEEGRGKTPQKNRKRKQKNGSGKTREGGGYLELHEIHCVEILLLHVHPAHAVAHAARLPVLLLPANYL
jgi:hypothetical protein